MTAANPSPNHGHDVQHLCRLAGLPRATYYRYVAAADEEGLDHDLQDAIQHICLKHRYYGYRRVTVLLRRQGHVVNAKKVLRLMREDNLLAMRRKPFLVPPSGKPESFVIVPNLVRGLVPSGPDQIWVADITYVHLARSFAYLAVILDAFSRKAVGWALAQNLHASLAIAALTQALEARRPARGGLIHHSDRGSQYVSIKYTERLAEAGIEPSVGSVGDSYDNALAETINGLYKAEVIHRRGPWRNFEAVEYATLEWVDWFNHRRLLEPIGNIPPAEAEEQYYAMIEQQPMAA